MGSNMAVKMTGAEWKAFYTDKTFWTDISHDEEVITINGKTDDSATYLDVEDTDVVRVEGGVVYDHGPTGDEYEPTCSLETYIKRWRKAQKQTILTVKIDKASEKALREIVETLGGKIL